MMSAAKLLLAIWSGLSTIFALRLLVTAVTNLLRRKALRRSAQGAAASEARGGAPKARPRRLLAVLGSGGHTAEMLKLVCDVAGAHTTVEYVISGGDGTSEARARALHGIGAPLMRTKCSFQRLPRARHVGESFSAATPRIVLCAVASIPALLRAQPQVVLCNGPGTSAIVGLAAVVLNAAGLLSARIIYAESVARVASLSVSGLMLYPFAHRFLVQWPQLAHRYTCAEFRGRYS